jgi:hypothetical protein
MNSYIPQNTDLILIGPPFNLESIDFNKIDLHSICSLPDSTLTL